MDACEPIVLWCVQAFTCTTSKFHIQYTLLILCSEAYQNCVILMLILFFLFSYMILFLEIRRGCLFSKFSCWKVEKNSYLLLEYVCYFCIDVWMYVYLYKVVCIHIYIFVCVFECYSNILIWISIQIYIYIYIQLCIYVFVQYTCICICIYIHCSI